MHVNGYAHFGGRHGESAALKNLLAFAGVANPATGRPFSEALCFGIAGGVGAGYSFCPSVVRRGFGSGVSIVGRHRDYATDASWYQNFFDRLGAKTRVTETAAPGKAFQNLRHELEAGRPAVVWCSRPGLSFVGSLHDSVGLWMHTFIVYAVDEDKGLAYGADRAPTKVTLPLDELAAARNGVCSHKNRTLTFDAPRGLTADRVRDAVRAGIRACAGELLQGRMKTFSLPGLEIWAKALTNARSKDGWPQVFKGGLLYCALRDVFNSVETAGTDGGLFRRLYADFLDEAAALLSNNALGEWAAEYRRLGDRWTELADAALPDKVKPFKKAKDLLRRQQRLFEQKGEKATKQIGDMLDELRAVEVEAQKSVPQGEEAAALLGGLRERVIDLHAAETAAAQRLAAAA